VKFCANDLRRTFATAGRDAGVPMLHVKLLMNHSVPDSDVTAGYMGEVLDTSMDTLRASQERVTAHLLQRMAPSGPENVVPLRAAQ
jgi:hypothetical protein